ncbi:MAG: hypothetical protein QHI38_06935 [Armatimonadota bacterium]|nr:hypothetical protein [Armatimonadota bacterium]
MKFLRNPEFRGMLLILVIIAGVGFALAVATGTLELFAGPQAFDKIVYVSEKTGTPEIWLMKPDGSGRVALTSGAVVRSAPAISPRANRIIYVGKFGKTEQVFAVGTRGGKPERLTSATGPKQQPAFTPDGTSISFIASGRVYAADKHGEHLSPIFPTPQEIHAAMTDPLRRGEMPIYIAYAWGPDSEAIVGIRQEPDGSHSAVFLPSRGAKPMFIPLGVYLNQLIAGAGAAQQRAEITRRVQVTGVSWSKTDSMFAITLTAESDSYLFVFVVEKGNPAIAGFKAFRGAVIAQPTFAPDGSALVVAVKSSRKHTEDGLLRLDLQSGTGQLLASGLFEQPLYSPSGDRILATRYDRAHTTKDLVSLDLSTGELKQLTHDGCSYFGIWTPSAKSQAGK